MPRSPAEQEAVARQARIEELAQEVAAQSVVRIDELALIGYPTSFDENTRDVVETAVRLAVRQTLEDGA